MITYSDLIQLKTYNERINALKLFNKVGKVTFGDERYLNQKFYKTAVWLSIRDKVIARDYGCDMGLYGLEINGKIIVHHISPITEDDIINRHPKVLDLNNLISTSLDTHNFIHYGVRKKNTIVKREKGDHILW